MRFREQDGHGEQDWAATKASLIDYSELHVWDVEYDFGSPERTALEGIRRIQGFFRSIGLPTTLKELGIPEDRLEEMAKRSTATGPLGNFVKLGAADVLKIYRLAS